MILIEKVNIYGWETAIRGMRNPLESWDKSDSYYGCRLGAERCDECEIYDCNYLEDNYYPGENDLALMLKLARAGSVHAKYRRMITVTLDITAPLYWWKEFDTYKVGTVANSCSTMHKIHAKEFTLDDFSHEHLGVTVTDDDGTVNVRNGFIDSLERTIQYLNLARNWYNVTTDPELKKQYWWQMIQLLPTSYNQKRTIQLNYEVLSGMYRDRKNHKLDEWKHFCGWIESLPYNEIIICDIK